MRILRGRFDLASRAGFLAVAVVLALALVGLRGADPGPVRTLRSAYFDTLQILAPRPYTPMPVLIVDLDEASLRALGQWPWPRDRMAALVDRLREMGAAVVVFDILFAEADRWSPKALLENSEVRAALGAGPWAEKLGGIDNDAAFARAIAKVPVVLGVSDAGLAGGAAVEGKASFVFLGRDPGAGLLGLRSATAVVPSLAAAAAGLGVVNVNPLELNDRIRSVPLVWRSGEGYIPGLALEALRVALGETTLAVKGSNDALNEVEAVRLGRTTIPTAPNGLFLLHYRHDQPSQYIPAHAVLDPVARAALGDRLKGAIVFVGASAAGLSDVRTTALGERVPGVSVHAQVVEQILLGAFLRRDTAVQGGEVAAFLGLALVVTVLLLLTGPVLSMIAGSLAAAAALGASWYLFATHGVLFDATFPLIGGFLLFSALAMFQFTVADRDKRLIRRSFAHYVAPSVLDEMDRAGHSLELGGTMGEVTVLFCDIRNFTPLSASMPAQDLVAFLNEIFSALSNEILAQSGTIDKYIGDEIMAFWNAPLAMAAHQRRACLATLQMRDALARYNARKALAGVAAVQVGMGLDCGLACVGNIGSRERFNYTAIGDTVNVAARTQAACKAVAHDILVTGDVARAAAGLAFLPAGRIPLKGVAERTEVFVLVGDAGLAETPGFAALREAHLRLVAALAGAGGAGAGGAGAGGAGAPLLEEALAWAEAIGVGLAPFLRRCALRAEDFAP